MEAQEAEALLKSGRSQALFSLQLSQTFPMISWQNGELNSTLPTARA